VSRTEDIPFNSSEATRLLYACPNLRSVQRVVPLDLPMSMFMRSPEAVVSHGLETTLDELSHALDLDPVELRLRNFSDTNQDTGQRYGSNHLAECYRRAATTFGWAKRDPRPGSMRDEHGLIGWGMATAAHTAGGWPGSAAKVEVRTDGTALIQSGTQDIGTGTYTVMTQLGADVLGLPLDAVRFELGDSAFPAAFASAASSTVPSVGSAIARAATAVRDAVIAIAVADPRSPLHGVDPALVTAADGQLVGADRRDSYRDVLARHGKPVTVTSKPEPTPLGYSVGAAFAEVSVDPLIGRVRVRRIVTCYDPGTVLNQQTARSQAIGGAVWAIGFVLSEHSSIDHQLGRIVNTNLSGYLVPVNADVPRIEVEFIDRPDPTSPAMGARGFGETPMTGVTAAIGNAIFHATGRRVRDLPITQDKLL
jgi:xanthine dehydrogenase YagR molybdenum-binding subunit